MPTLQKPWLHYTLISAAFIISLLYSLPNIYPEKPAILINTDTTSAASYAANLVQSSELQGFKPTCSNLSDSQLSCVFSSVDQQMQAKAWIDTQLKEGMHAGLALIDSTPQWMQYLGLKPMKLGLDLRGGVHLLVQVDTKNATSANQDLPSRDILKFLRDKSLSYLSARNAHASLELTFSSTRDQTQAIESLQKQFPLTDVESHDLTLTIKPKSESVAQRSQYIINKTLESVERRVNELGLSEAIVQKQGDNQISIDLPGIQDINHAKNILGNTATLSFQMVAGDVNPESIPRNKSQLIESVTDAKGRKLAVYKNSVLSGDAITYATASSQEGKPVVQIQLGGGGEERFYQTTKEHVGDQLAIILIESSLDSETGNRILHKRVISAPVIQQPLRHSFVITGMHSYSETETLSLLLRSGSLAAPIDIVQETTIGPSLGAENIQKGVFSIVVGFALIMVFMVVYYRTFGAIANVALLMNLLTIVCLLSWLSATLTLPAMAAIVLTVGMAVDANVLINERIREELREGSSAQDALIAGYEKAFATIFDANITTLIVSLVLFSLSSGMIKGFAVTLIIGIAASMFTSVYITRVISWSLFPFLQNLPRAIGI